MKIQFIGRVIGHELIEGEKPKTDAEAMKVKLAVRHVGDLPGNSSSGTLRLPADIATRDFPLKRLLLISIEEGQKELWDAVVADEKPTRTKDPLQQEIGMPRGDSPIARPPLRELGIVPGRRGRKNARASAETEN
jgi:hypothetical protein